MKKSNKKWLTTTAAICSSVFLFAACEPGDDQRPAEGPADPGAPTYGEPDRAPLPEHQQDPSSPGQPADQQWEDDGLGDDTGMQ